MDTEETTYDFSQLDNYITDIQQRKRRILSISLTNYCNINCAHCIRNAGGINKTHLSGSIIEKIVDDFSKIGNKVKFLGLTGGEPFQRPDAIKTLSKAGAECGMSVGVVSNAYWAESLDHAIDVIDEFIYIDQYDISTDFFHLEYIPLSYIKNVYSAAKKRNKKVVIRLTEGCALPYAEQKIIEEVKSFAGEDVSIQNLFYFGRAKSLNTLATPTKSLPYLPCFTEGPFIREDGIVLPCCKSLAGIDSLHPLILGNLNYQSLADIFTLSEQNPILHFIRVWGFGPIYEMMEKSDIANLLPEITTGMDACSICAQIFSNPEFCEYIKLLSNKFEFKLHVAVGRWHYLKESDMLDAINNYR